MPRRAYDLTGVKFGRLTVIENVGKAKSGNYIWRCQCECGDTKDVVAGNLCCGSVKSCGCLVRERQKKAEGEV